eukprot:10944421-Alexandrium_andersonii.AAC.1
MHRPPSQVAMQNRSSHADHRETKGFGPVRLWPPWHLQSLGNQLETLDVDASIGLHLQIEHSPWTMGAGDK